MLGRRSFLRQGGAVAVAAGGAAIGAPWVARAAERFVQPPLPFAEGALAPTISAQTVGLHYGKHHAGYYTMLNQLVQGTPFADMSLEQVVAASAAPEHQKIFNQAGQAWNHVVYWEELRPGGAKAPGGRLAQMIERDLGGVAKMKEDFVKGATSEVFGSGWYWLVQDGDKLALMGTRNGDNPLAQGKKTLMGIDVWEHAYYLDYQNRRGEHVKAVLDNLINWDYVAQRMEA